MNRTLKLAHLVGLVLFLGSIFTFIVVSALVDGASLENLAFGRRIISRGTVVLTLPGLWLMVITGLWMGYRRYGFASRFVQIKLALAILIVLNAHLVIVPAADHATTLAEISRASDQLLPEYHAAYLRETVFGAVNVLLAIAAAVVGIWKIGARPTAGRD